MVSNLFRLVWISVGLLCVVLTTWSQDNKPSRKAEKAYDRALDAYAFRQYDLATEEVSKAIDLCPNYVDAWFLRAQMFDDLDHPQVGEVLAKALALDPNKFPSGWVLLAQIWWEQGQYEEGLSALEELDQLPMAELSAREALQRNWVEAGLRFSVQALQDWEGGVKAFPVRGDLNTPEEEYYGALDLSGTHMVLTRVSRSGRLDVDVPGVVGGEDFFESFMRQDSTWTPPRPLFGVNTPMNEGAPTLSGDGRTMVFAACETPREGYGPRRGKGSCDLFESQWDEETQRWSMGHNLGAPNSSGWESQPSLSADGNMLVFARSPRGRNEPSNLVVCHREPNGGWTSPEPISGPINTPYTEESPFLHPDGKSLYFSSDGHPGFGRLDVFVSRLQPDGSWGEPINLGPGINSFGKDNSLMVMPHGGWAMYSTTKESGNLDFWQVPLPREVQPLEVGMLSGVVLDSRTRLPIEADVALVDLGTGQMLSHLVSSQRQGFLLPLPKEGEYSFEASAVGYMFGMELYDQASASGDVRDATAQVEILLDPIEEGSSFVMKSIHFDHGLSALSSEYQAGCERLAQWLLQNPGLRIRIEGHTDNVGADEFNLKLSSDRAKAVRTFLIERGVDVADITVEGKGATHPIADNATEEGRALNRRVQVVVL